MRYRCPPLSIFLKKKKKKKWLVSIFLHIIRILQLWFRKIQSLDLVQYYNDKNSEIDSWIRYTFGLTFLTPRKVSICFIEDIMSNIPNNKRVS
jgi:hypothetical protein